MDQKDVKTLLAMIVQIQTDINLLKVAVRGDFTKKGNENSILQRLKALERSHKFISWLLGATFIAFIGACAKAWFF